MQNKNTIVTEALIATSLDAKAAYNTLGAEVGLGSMIFTFNPGAGSAREPRMLGERMYLGANGKFYRDADFRLEVADPTGARKSHRSRTQHEMCLRMCYAIANDLRKAGNIPGPKPPTTNPPRPEAKPEAKPQPPKSMGAEIDRFLAEIERLRAEMKRRGDFDPLDSMRITIDGVKAIKAGVPVDGLLCAIGASWNEESRQQMRIPEFDYAAWGRAQDDYDPRYHAAMPYVRRLMDAGVHVWLHGPAGTSKSSIAQAIADIRKVDYHEVNLAAAMASAIKGKDRLKEFVTSEFTQAYVKPSVLALEEFDSAMPSTATAVNNAIANGHFHNDADGDVYTRHPDFRLVATANSLGNGATKQFSSRMNLDGATKDRFRMGRVFIGLDRELERNIIESIVAA